MVAEATGVIPGYQCGGRAAVGGQAGNCAPPWSPPAWLCSSLDPLKHACLSSTARRDGRAASGWGEDGDTGPSPAASSAGGTRAAVDARRAAEEAAAQMRERVAELRRALDDRETGGCDGVRDGARRDAAEAALAAIRCRNRALAAAVADLESELIMARATCLAEEAKTEEEATKAKIWTDRDILKKGEETLMAETQHKADLNVLIERLKGDNELAPDEQKAQDQAATWVEEEAELKVLFQKEAQKKALQGVESNWSR